jgi:hypothetical protein
MGIETVHDQAFADMRLQHGSQVQNRNVIFLTMPDDRAMGRYERVIGTQVVQSGRESRKLSRFTGDLCRNARSAAAIDLPQYQIRAAGVEDGFVARCRRIRQRYGGRANVLPDRPVAAFLLPFRQGWGDNLPHLNNFEVAPED